MGRSLDHAARLWSEQIAKWSGLFRGLAVEKTLRLRLVPMIEAYSCLKAVILLDPIRVLFLDVYCYSFP